MGDARHDDLLDVAEDGRPALAVDRRRLGQEGLHVAGLDVGEDAPRSNRFQVVGDVVHQLFSCLVFEVPD